MANLISDADKVIYESAIQDIADTFGRDIVAWKRSAERVVTANDDNDSFYDNKKKPNITYTYQTGVFKARIKYIDRQDKEFYIAMSDAQVQVTQDTQLVRLKINVENCDFIREADKVTVDGVDFRIVTSPRNHGVFSNNFCTFYARS